MSRPSAWLVAVVPWCVSCASTGPTGGVDPGGGGDVPEDGVTDLAGDAGETPAWDPVPIEPSQAFLDRRASWLDACFAAAGPGKGGLYGQVCRVARGGDVNVEAIAAACDKADGRKDTADFGVAALLRILWLDRENHSLDEATRERIGQTVLGFKYWLDEPGKDRMCYWSENHQILFHSNELLAGLLFPDEVFSNAGMTGRQHADHARPYVERWLGFRARFGFSEWHSNVYFNEDVPALLNLVDFADDEAIRTRAAGVLDSMLFDMLANTFDGVLATAHGRTYQGHLVPVLSDSTREFAYIALGIGWTADPGSFSGAFLATSARYVPPVTLEEAAGATRERFEHRQRDGIDVAQGPEFGVGYESHDDVVFWAGMAALAAPEVIEGTVALLDDLDLWDGFLFGDLPAEYRDLLRNGAEAGTLPDLATDLEAVSRGIALEAMSTYTYRTPHFQLSGAQSYHPGMWGAQTGVWQAALTKEAHVFTTWPSLIEGQGDLEFAGEWIGSWLPRATFFRNVGVIQYRRQPVPVFDGVVKTGDPHAFFPRGAFDEVRESAGTTGRWVFGRKGEGFIGLWSRNAVTWAEGNDYELKAPGEDGNVWVVEMGSTEDGLSFDAFVDRLTAAQVAAPAGGAVRFVSPSQGVVDVGWEGPMTVAGTAVDIGPYARWDDPLVHQEFGSTRTTIEVGDRRLELDFDAPARRELVAAGGRSR